MQAPEVVPVPAPCCAGQVWVPVEYVTNGGGRHVRLRVDGAAAVRAARAHVETEHHAEA